MSFPAIGCTVNCDELVIAFLTFILRLDLFNKCVTLPITSTDGTSHYPPCLISLAYDANGQELLLQLLTRISHSPPLTINRTHATAEEDQEAEHHVCLAKGIDSSSLVDKCYKPYCMLIENNRFSLSTNLVLYTLRIRSLQSLPFACPLSCKSNNIWCCKHTQCRRTIYHPRFRS